MTKEKKLNNCTVGEKVEIPLMIKKITDQKESMYWAYAGDKDKDIKCIIKYEDEPIKEGSVLILKGSYSEPFKPSSYKVVHEYNVEDFLPAVKRPIEDIMNELDEMSNEEFKSEEAKALNDYFFKDEHFVEKFKKAIGGVFNHHNYLGGLAEHTLGVMYLSKIYAYRYDIRYKEIAILGAKLHDIGKVYEMSYDGPFNYTLKGNMQGHIVMGVVMVEKAFNEIGTEFSEEFKERIKGIIVEHHGKVEYGSPVSPRSEEAFVVHYADYVDASLNKIKIIGDGTPSGEWTSYDRRIETRLFM